MIIGEICACGARGEHKRCWAQAALRVEEVDDLRAMVLAALPAPSANELARRVARQRSAVLEAVRRLVEEGAIAKTASGLVATTTSHDAATARYGPNGNVASCDHAAGEATFVGHDAGAR